MLFEKNHAMSVQRGNKLALNVFDEKRRYKNNNKSELWFWATPYLGKVIVLRESL